MRSRVLTRRGAACRQLRTWNRRKDHGGHDLVASVRQRDGSSSSAFHQGAFRNVFQVTFGFTQWGRLETAAAEDVADRGWGNDVTQILEGTLETVVAQPGLSFAIFTTKRGEISTCRHPEQLLCFLALAECQKPEKEKPVGGIGGKRGTGAG
jgi:hypothetical protein